MSGAGLREANLAVLARTQPDLARRLARAAPSPELEVVPAKDGRPVLKKAGQSLHSRQDPVAEAGAFVRSEEVQAARQAERLPVVFGFGLGYHLRALAQVFERLVVYEPDPAVLLTALEVLDWTDLLPRLTLLTAGETLPAQVQGQAAFLVHRPTQRLAPAECARLRAAVEGRARGLRGRSPEAKWKILVVSPLYGGSLPVTRHVVRALKGLGHQVIEADMSPLDPLYQRVRQAPAPAARRNKAISGMIRFAGEYVALLAETARPDLLLALAQAPLDRAALARIRSLGVPSAFWFVEDYRLMGYFREVAASYDFFFHIQGEALEEELTRLGVRHFHYLPLAADPDLFRPVDDPEVLSPYKADLSFMGSGYPNRRAVFAQLLDYDLKIWGTEWDLETELGCRVQDNCRRVPTEETPLIYNAARINLNLHSSVFSTGLDFEGGFVNPRTFEVAACAAFQLVDRRRPLGRHFALEKEVATFADLSELRRKVDLYLAEPELRAKMAGQARARVLAEHTYAHRMKSLLEFVGRQA